MPISEYTRLDSKYFDTVSTTEGPDYIYHVIRPKDSPMILFSLSDPRGPIPIAALHLRTQSFYEQNDGLGNRGRALITQRWKNSPLKCDFQGVITKDNQNYEFILTNLTTGDDYVNINILKKDVAVIEKDPGVAGHGLNAINEIRPYQSYAVQCDQKDSKSLILRSIKTSTGEQVTVKEDESNGIENAQGTYYYISVIGAKGPTADLFKETVWACVDYFITMIPRPKPVSRPSYDDYEEEGVLECATFIPQSFSLHGGHSSLERGRGTFQSPGIVLESTRSTRSARDFSGPVLKCASIGAESFSVSGSRSTINDDDDMIGQSYASTVDSGRRIQENIGQTTADYDFSRPSAHCCLGLSISDQVAFYPPPSKDWIVAKTDQTISDYIANNAKTYIDRLKQVYKEENCCICLEVSPDTVIYQCGHQCLHNTCLTEKVDSCPLCRGHISAKIKV